MMFYGETPLGQGLYNLLPEAYLGVIQEENIAWHKTLRTLLAFVGNNDPYAFAVVGSDGRLERHEKRPTDLIVIADSAQDYPAWDLLTYLGQYGILLERGEPQIYDLSDGLPLSEPRGLQKKAFPDYVLYSDHVGGNHSTWHTARNRVLEELRHPKIRRDIIDRNRREYARTATTGMCRGERVFDPNNGIQFYNNGENSKAQLGFKIPFLRLVQSWLDVKTIDYINYFGYDPEHINALAAYMPTSVPDRLCFIGQHGGLEEGWEHIYPAYGWFLREYHYAQERYTREGHTQSPFDKEEFQYYSYVLLNGCVYHS